VPQQSSTRSSASPPPAAYASSSSSYAPRSPGSASSSSSRPPPMPQQSSTRSSVSPPPAAASSGNAPPIIPPASRASMRAPPVNIAPIMAQLTLGVLPRTRYDMSIQRILLINLYLNQIFNAIILKYKKQKTNPAADLTIKSTYKYKDPLTINHAFDFPVYPQIYRKNDEKVISKINSLLDEGNTIRLISCGGGRLNKYARKNKTVKKKIRNIRNKNSLKNKINKKIKKCIKKNIKQKKQQKENKHIIKKFLNSKIREKINKYKLNKNKNWSKNKSSRHSYTRKNY
jgi:hypothetical protein